MIFRFAAPAVCLVAAATFAGCSSNETLIGPNTVTTASVAPVPVIDPACSGLSTRIETLRNEGIPGKLEKAAIKKYKMTQADLGKADELTKANAEFQTKCSKLPPRPVTAQVPAGTSQVATAAAAKPATSATPAAPPVSQLPAIEAQAAPKQ